MLEKERSIDGKGMGTGVKGIGMVVNDRCCPARMENGSAGKLNVLGPKPLERDGAGVEGGLKVRAALANMGH